MNDISFYGSDKRIFFFFIIIIMTSQYRKRQFSAHDFANLSVANHRS